MSTRPEVPWLQSRSESQKPGVVERDHFGLGVSHHLYAVLLQCTQYRRIVVESQNRVLPRFIAVGGVLTLERRHTRGKIVLIP